MGIKNFNHIKQLGAGSFGSVSLVKRSPPSKHWTFAAMKKITNPSRNAENEVEFLKRFQHPNIINYYTSFTCVNSGDFCIIMEYCDQGSLTDYVYSHRVSKVI